MMNFLHPYLPWHRSRMNRAVLCVQSSNHFGERYRRAWLRQASLQVDLCGCPESMWPDMLKLHVGVG